MSHVTCYFFVNQAISRELGKHVWMTSIDGSLSSIFNQKFNLKKKFIVNNGRRKSLFLSRVLILLDTIIFPSYLKQADAIVFHFQRENFSFVTISWKSARICSYRKSISNFAIKRDWMTENNATMRSRTGQLRAVGIIYTYFAAILY